MSNNHSERQTFKDQEQQHQNIYVRCKQIEDYKQLYFNEMKKVQRLTQIQTINKNTHLHIYQQQISQENQKYIKQIQSLSNANAKLNQQNKKHLEQIKKLSQSFQQRQSFWTKKYDLQKKQKQVLKQQIDLLRQQLKYTKKQVTNLQKSINNQINRSIQDINLNNLQTNKQEKQQDIYKKIIKAQQNQIQTIKQSNKKLQQTLSKERQTIFKLTLQKNSITQLYQIQIQSKQKQIHYFKQQISDKQQQINLISDFKRLKHENKSLLAKICQSQQLLKMKQTELMNLKKLNKNYQTLIKQYQDKQSSLYLQLQSKQIIIEELQAKQKQYQKQISWLNGLIMELKGSYIHSQLEKQNLQSKFKEQKKRYSNTRSNCSLLGNESNLQRFSNFSTKSPNISRLKLDKSNSTKQNSSVSTPNNSSSLNCSKILIENQCDFFNQILTQQSQKQNKSVNSSSYNNSKINVKQRLSSIKNSFYKNKNKDKLLVLDNRRLSSKRGSQNFIKPFQI